MNKVRAKSPANPERSAHKTEEAPAVPPKAEEAPVAAPAVDEPTITAPATEAAPVEEAVVEPTAKITTPKESRRKSYFGAPGNKISSIFRRPSQAVRSNKDTKKENITPAAEEGAATTTEMPVVSEPVKTETPAVAETKPQEPQQSQAIGDVGPESISVGQEHKSSPVVSAAA